MKKRVGVRRRISALAFVTATIGLVAVGFASQASASPGIEQIAGGSQSVNPNKSITVPVTTGTVADDTVIVSVATGTFAGDVGCSDSQANTYVKVADKNTGNGRLFVCASTLGTALSTSDTITATYPGFSGLSVITAVRVCGPINSCFTGGYAGGAVSTNAGSNPAVSSGPPVTVGDTFLFGVVANGNVSTFTPTPLSGWNVVGVQSGGSGAATRTLTPVWQDVGSCTCNVTGTLSGSGFWQAALVTFTT